GIPRIVPPGRRPVHAPKRGSREEAAALAGARGPGYAGVRGRRRRGSPPLPSPPAVALRRRLPPHGGRPGGVDRDRSGGRAGSRPRPIAGLPAPRRRGDAGRRGRLLRAARLPAGRAPRLRAPPAGRAAHPVLRRLARRQGEGGRARRRPRAPGIRAVLRASRLEPQPLVALERGGAPPGPPPAVPAGGAARASPPLPRLAARAA